MNPGSIDVVDKKDSPYLNLKTQTVCVKSDSTLFQPVHCNVSSTIRLFVLTQHKNASKVFNSLEITFKQAVGGKLKNETIKYNCRIM